MTFRSSANGVAKKGKTAGKQLGIDGAKLSTDGGVSKGGGASSVSNKSRKALGRNLSRVANQKG
jgi:hypothetical protein